MSEQVTLTGQPGLEKLSGNGGAPSSPERVWVRELDDGQIVEECSPFASASFARSETGASGFG